MKSLSLLSAGFLALVILGAGCTTEPPTSHASLANTSWLLASFNGASTTNGSVLNFENDGRFRAKFCNSMSGSYTFNGTVLTSTNTLSTMMACLDDRMTQETAFGKGLADGFTVTLTSDALILRGTDGTVFNFNLSLRDSASVPASTTDATTTYRGSTFEMSYPTAQFTTQDAANGILDGGIITFVLDNKIFNPEDKNNLLGAWIDISSTSSPNAQKICTSFEDYKSYAKDATVRTQKINGLTFSITTRPDAGMSQLYDTHAYRTFHDGTCYEVALTAHTGNAQVFDPPLQEIDTAKVFSYLEKTLATFRFSK